MKFYIASRLENAAAVSRISAALTSVGHECTYDWTKHGSVKSEGADRLCEVGENERWGVINADWVIVLLPSGRGTHVEFGIALGSGASIFLCAEDNKFFKFNDDTTPFYWCDGVQRIVGDEARWISEIAKISVNTAKLFLSDISVDFI